MKHIHMRRSSHWGRLRKADTSVSSINANSSRRLVCLFSSPSSTSRTWLMALPRVWAPPAWRQEHVGLQSLESAPELGIWVHLRARQPWLGNTHPPSVETIVEEPSTRWRAQQAWDIFLLPVSYPQTSSSISKHGFSLTKVLYKRRNPCLPFSLLCMSTIVLWVFHLVEYLTMLPILEYVHQW